MKRPDLKPCPFCGNTNIGILYGKEAYQSKDYFPAFEASVRCLRCGIGTRKRSHAEIAVNLWNRRENEAGEAERAAMKRACWMYDCYECKHVRNGEETEKCDENGCRECQQKCPCRTCVDGCNWQWRGET